MAHIVYFSAKILLKTDSCARQPVVLEHLAPEKCGERAGAVLTRLCIARRTRSQHLANSQRIDDKTLSLIDGKALT